MVRSYGNALLLLLTLLQACGLSGHIFAASASPRSVTKLKLAAYMLYVTVFRCSWGSVWYQICDNPVDTASGIRGGVPIVAFSLNRLVVARSQPNTNEGVHRNERARNRESEGASSNKTLNTAVTPPSCG